jgi:hypothetical protein
MTEKADGHARTMVWLLPMLILAPYSQRLQLCSLVHPLLTFLTGQGGLYF